MSRARVAAATCAAVVATALAGCGGAEPAATPVPVTTTPAFVDAASPASVGPTSPASPGSGDPVWGSPVFSDDFSGSLLDRARWGIYDDPDGQHPRVPEAVRVVDGELRLTERWYPSVGKYASGGVAAKFSQLYGRWEVRFRIDAGGGSSAVVLLWPVSEQWPEDGEIDGIEVGGGNRRGGGAFVHNGASHLRAVGEVDADFTQWHTITIDWLPDSVTFYLDGRQYFRETRRAYIPSTSRMFLALQLDVVCDEWNECRDGSTPDEVVMHVDYVRIYARPR